MVNESEMLCRAIFIDTDNREKETEKHSFSYLENLQRAINSQALKLRMLIQEEETLSASEWENTLRDLKGLVNEAKRLDQGILRGITTSLDQIYFANFNI